MVDDLLEELNEICFTTQRYADDLVVIGRGRHDKIISDIMQTALKIISNWCARDELGVNPNKTVLVPFTKRGKHELKVSTLGGSQHLDDPEADLEQSY